MKINQGEKLTGSTQPLFSYVFIRKAFNLSLARYEQAGKKPSPYNFVSLLNRILTQLTVFTGPAVITSEAGLLIFEGLASNTQPHPWNGLAASLGNRLITVFTKFSTGPLGQLLTCTLYGIINGAVFLLLSGALTRPANGHNNLLNIYS